MMNALYIVNEERRMPMKNIYEILIEHCTDVLDEVAFQNEDFCAVD